MPKILIAEDDLMIADSIEDVLAAHAYDVCGIGRTVDEAVDLCVRHSPDLALIDLRLADGGLGTEVPRRLSGMARVGILYASGNISQFVLTAADGEASLSKPYRFTDLLRGLDIVAAMVATGHAPGPFPRGFKVLQTV